MCSTMPRSTAHRASSLRLQWLSGRSLCSAGCSQANATIAQICSGVNARWCARTRRIGQALSDRRGLRRGAPATLANGVPSSAKRQAGARLSRTPTPAAASKISCARSASFRGVVCARTRRISTCSCAGVITMGSADRRGIGASANRRTNGRFAMPPHAPLDSPHRLSRAGHRPIFLRLWQSGLTLPRYGVATSSVRH